jgi:uncharacterized protein
MQDDRLMPRITVAMEIIACIGLRNRLVNGWLWAVPWHWLKTFSLDKHRPGLILPAYLRANTYQELLVLNIELDDIKDQGLSLERSESFEHFPVLNELHGSGEAVFVQPLDIQVTARRYDEMIVVEGVVTTVVRLQCCRCLQEFEQSLDIPFSLTFERHDPQMEVEEEEEVELQAEDLGVLSFEGDEIDLSESIQEQVVMALPIKPLCHEGCRGLCSQCGADLNEGDCGCREKVMEGKFAALKNFKVKKKE